MSNTKEDSEKNKSDYFPLQIGDKILRWVEWAIIIGFCSIPLFVKFPFRINLFLAWEGAYRLSEGQIPFRDFGMPLGFGFWIIPAFFFKIFGPQMITLVKAQVLINGITIWSFRSILKTLKIDASQRLIALLVLGLTYILINFWPWYNNMVFVFELLAVQTILLGTYQYKGFKSTLLIVLSAFFVVLSIFTKQDGGGLALILVSALLMFYVYRHQHWSLLRTFIISGVLWGLIAVVPFMFYDFEYWFNYGQSPHYSRINMYDFLDAVLGESMVIKLYIALILLLLVNRFRSWERFWKEEQAVLMALLSLSFLCQALLVQVTSYIPHNVNVYFHSFAIISIIYLAQDQVPCNRVSILIPSIFLVFFCFSGDYWLYANRIFRKIFPVQNTQAVVSKNTWSLSDSTTQVSRSNWVESDYWVFNDIYLPEETIRGIKSIEELAIVKEKGGELQVLNMTELTPLVQILGYKLESGADYPLWFHYGVSMFDREVDRFCQKIEDHEYDLILFETIPNLNDFYPSAVRNCILQHYQLQERFLAPRVKHNAHIEVYTHN
jgi:hypothetical protein